MNWNSIVLVGKGRGKRDERKEKNKEILGFVGDSIVSTYAPGRLWPIRLRYDPVRR